MHSKIYQISLFSSIQEKKLPRYSVLACPTDWTQIHTLVLRLKKSSTHTHHAHVSNLQSSSTNPSQPEAGASSFPVLTGPVIVMQAFILKLKLIWKIPSLVNLKLSPSNPNENAARLLTYSCFSLRDRLLVFPAAQLILPYKKFPAGMMVWPQLLKPYSRVSAPHTWTCILPCLQGEMVERRFLNLPNYFFVLLIVWPQVVISDAEGWACFPSSPQASCFGCCLVI